MIRALFNEPQVSQNQCVGFLQNDATPTPDGQYAIEVTVSVLHHWFDAVWYMDDGGFTTRPTVDVEADLAAEQAEAAVEADRINEIKEAKTTSAFAGKSVQEIIVMISEALQPTTDHEEFKTVVIQLLIEAAPFLADEGK